MRLDRKSTLLAFGPLSTALLPAQPARKPALTPGKQRRTR